MNRPIGSVGRSIAFKKCTITVSPLRNCRYLKQDFHRVIDPIAKLERLYAMTT